MSQTTAPQIEMDVGSDGLIADGVSPCRVETGVNPSAAMPLGYGASLDNSGDGLLKLPGTAADITADFAGVVVKRETKVSDPNAALPQYAAKDSVPYLRQGKAWVRVKDAVTRGADAYVRWQAGDVGQFASSADAANVAQVPTGKYRTSAGAGELAIVELSLP